MKQHILILAVVAFLGLCAYGYVAYIAPEEFTTVSPFPLKEREVVDQEKEGLDLRIDEDVITLSIAGMSQKKLQFVMHAMADEGKEVESAVDPSRVWFQAHTNTVFYHEYDDPHGDTAHLRIYMRTGSSLEEQLFEIAKAFNPDLDEAKMRDLCTLWENKVGGATYYALRGDSTLSRDYIDQKYGKEFLEALVDTDVYCDGLNGALYVVLDNLLIGNHGRAIDAMQPKVRNGTIKLVP